MSIVQSFWVQGLMPVQFILLFVFAVVVLIAAQSILKRFHRRITAFWQALVVWFTSYAILKFVVVPPLPASLLYQYLAVIAVATFLWVSATEPSWSECKHTVLSLLGGRTVGWQVARAAVFVALPILVAKGLHEQLTPKFELPIELRTVNPAPPASITVDGRPFVLQSEANPFRVDDVGQVTNVRQGPYSYRVQEQDVSADLWSSKETIPYVRYVREGGAIYFQHCHFCHGGALDGQGIFAYANNPLPPDFSHPGTIAQIEESYVFWRTYSGGQGMPREGFPWASTMPAYSGDLRTPEIWQVILFMYWYTGYNPRSWN